MTSQAKPRPSRGGGGIIKEFSFSVEFGPVDNGPERKAPDDSPAEDQMVSFHSVNIKGVRMVVFI